jgi:hypothetical protein
MAPKPLSPIEALAKRQVKPITPVKTGVVKQAAPPPTPPKSAAQEYLDSLKQPQTNATTPAATVPNNRPFVGPTLDPEVIQERTKLKSQELQALQAGIDPAIVKSIVAGEGDPNRGFLGPARWLGNVIKNIYDVDLVKGEGEFQPFVKIANFDPIKGDREFKPIKATGKAAATVGTKVLLAASPAIDKLDFGRRFVTSTLNEVGDLLGQGRKAVGNKYGLGKVVGSKGFLGIPGTSQEGNNIGSPSLGDWWYQLSKEGGISGGEPFANIKNPYMNQLFGFMADVFLDPVTYVTGPGGIGKTAISRGIITSGTNKGAKIAARAAVAQADQFGAALARKLALEELDDAVRFGGDVAVAESKLALANKQAADAAKKLAGDAAGRSMGRTSNQALAEQVLGIRDEAQKVIDLGTAGPEELAYAQRAVEVLNDAAIANIQKSGLAGIAGPFIDIVRGVRTPAQDILGVRGGLRITNPLAALGGPGPLRAVVPGTERLTNVAGKAIAEARLGLFKGPIGPLTTKVLNNITPTGDGGILGSADLLELRTGLRRGGLSPKQATEATRLLQLDQQYRALVQNERKIAGGFLGQSGLGKGELDGDTLNEVVRLRQTAAATKTPVVFTPEQQIAADALDKYFDDLYQFSVKASEGTGYVPPRRTDYFPQMQSDEAIRWAERFPDKAEELAKQLKVDRTWFVGNFRARELKAGDKFFGKELEQIDIDGGAQALNAIARKWGLKFDYFETDALTAIGKYTQRHAQFTALQKSIGSLPETLPSMAARVREVRAPDGSIQGTKFDTPRATEPLRPIAVEFRLEDPATGVVLDPTPMLEALSKGELQSLVDDVKTIAEKLDPKVVVKKDIEGLLENLQNKLDIIEDDYVSGVLSPPASFVASDEVIKTAKILQNDLNDVVFDVASVPASRWSDYVDIAKKGFEVLNGSYTDPTTGKFIQGTAPNIAVKAELADLLRNAERLNDPAFAARAQQIVQDYTRFSKAYLVARPGFHTRNAFSNVFQLIAAGANPANLVKGNRMLNRINRGLKAGLTPRQVATEIVESDLVKVNKDLFDYQKTFRTRRQVIDAIEDSINYSGSTGFGQFGEIAAEVGTQNRGLLQKGAPKGLKGVRNFDRGLTKQISKGAGGLLVWNRKAGEFVENYSRFGLMWDGISKGLSPQEAAARANKYLIDYSDLSKADRVAKQIIPFWTFMSRNTPLQLELMWTNPRAYALYNNLKDNFEGPSEEEGGPVIPGYEKDRGVFPLQTPINIPGMPESVKNAGRFAGAVPGVGPALGLLSQFPGLQGDVIRPGLPFPGGGENVLKGLIENPKGFLANTNPVFRVPLEAAFGVKLFTGAPIAEKGQAATSTAAKLKYLGRELFSPTSPIVSLLRTIPPVAQSKFLEEYFGVNPDDAEPMVQTVNSILSYIGAPLGTQRTESSVNELKSRFYDLEAYIKDAQDRAKIKQEERIEKAKQNPVAPGVNPFLPSTTTP